MPLHCISCNTIKGYNKFHSIERRLRESNPTCKECIKNGVAPYISNDSTTCIDHFEMICVIGQGAYGRVLQVRHRKTLQVFAMKIISKAFLVEKDTIKYMQSERDIMTKIDFPFIVKLHYAFQSTDLVYLVMDYQAGGELFTHMKNSGCFLENTAKFYIAEMVLAIEHLHSIGILHRDLKPENCLLSSSGHLKLTDFGVATSVSTSSSSSTTLCGTIEYMAPEMVLGHGYNHAVDYWSLGAVAYEMLVGHAPFEATSRKKLQQKILSEKLFLPSYLSSEAHSLLKSLLERNVERRLGATKSSMFKVGGVRELKNHAFFKGIKWNDMLNSVPPIKFDLTGESDTSNFDKEFTSQDVLNFPHTKSNDCSTTTRLRGFTFTAPTTTCENTTTDGSTGSESAHVTSDADNDKKHNINTSNNNTASTTTTSNSEITEIADDWENIKLS